MDRSTARSTPVPSDDLEARLARWAPVLPSTGAFAHLTAAAVHDMRLPELPRTLPTFACVPTGVTRPQHRGLVVRRHVVPPEIELIGGYPVVGVPDLLLGCAYDLGVLDLVGLVDGYLARAGDPLAAREALLRVAQPRRLGAARLRAAVHLADHRSESWWETALRLFHVAVGAEVEPQHEVVRDGVLVARADLWLVGTTSLHEYDGGVHRDVTAHRADLRRDRRIISAGYVRRGFSSPDLVHRSTAVLRDVDEALGRRHDPSRAAAWYVLLRDSLVTPVGRARLVARWRGRGQAPSHVPRRSEEFARYGV